MNSGTSDAVWWYLHELTSRVVAQTGNPNDRYHLGKITLQSFKDVPDMIMQIDGATDEKETFRSVMHRSVRCATALSKLGLKQHDVIILMGPNHLDITIPMYAAFYLGVSVVRLDINCRLNELQLMLKLAVPKIVFCENSSVKNIAESLELLNISTIIITFGQNKEHLCFTELLDKYSDDGPIENYQPADFDPIFTNALLVLTSGSLGMPKLTALTHKNIFIGFPYLVCSRLNFPTPFEVGLVLSPIQWLGAMFQNVLSPIMKYTRLQSSATLTLTHVSMLFKKYKPHYTMMSPPFLISLLKSDIQFDISSLQFCVIAGSAVSKKLLEEFKKVAPQCDVKIGYGLSEISGLFNGDMFSPPGSIGLPLNHLQWKIVDPDTNEIIAKPNVPGELLLKGPSVTKGYYNNSDMNSVAIDENGWFKTGDLVYRDHNYSFYFVDRLKLLLKYNNHQVFPVEMEDIILEHPGVLNVAVTGVPDSVCGDLPVAVVVRRKGAVVTAQEIKDLVKNTLSDAKQLRGGVIFVTDLPTTSTSKIDRVKIKELAMSSIREYFFLLKKIKWKFCAKIIHIHIQNVSSK